MFASVDDCVSKDGPKPLKFGEANAVKTDWEDIIELVVFVGSVLAEKTKLNPPAFVELETVLVTLDTLELCILLSGLVVETPKLKPGKPGAVVAAGVVVNVGNFVTEVLVVAIKLVSPVILG